jgi:hypothetical protein
VDSLNPRIILNGSTLLAVKSFPNYQWLLNGEPVIGANTIAYSPGNKFGNYSLEVTNAQGCKDTSNTLLFLIEDVAELENTILKLYPNPAHDVLVVNTNTTSDYSIEIFDVNGKRVKQFNNTLNNNEMSLDVADVAKGLYILRLQSKGQTTVRRFVKQ